MAAEPVIKICGITTEADALLAVGLAADALGFIFAPSPRQMTAGAVSDIVKRLPAEVLTVGVFRDESARRVVEIANTVGLGAVQLHGHESIEDSPGSGEVFDWRLAEGVVDHGRLFVSGGLNSANVADAVVRLHPHGVDVATGVERAPGEKDPAKLAAFVAAVRRGAALVAAEHPGAAGDDDADDAPYDWLTDR